MIKYVEVEGKETSTLALEEVEFERLGELAARGFLARLSPDLIAQLVQSGRTVHYPSKRFVVSPNAIGGALVLSGLLRYFLAAPDGRQMTIRYVGPGDLVGAMVVEPSDISTNIQALEPSVLLHLDPFRVRSLAAQQPTLALALVDELTHRLRQAYRALAAGTFTSVSSRVARDLVERASMRGQLHAGVHVTVTQQSLADATGTVREVVARALRKLRRDGVIATVGGTITILDADALAGLAGTAT